MQRRTFVYVVCSPRRRIGTTLFARLLVEFFLLDDIAVVGFDTCSYEPDLADHLPLQSTVLDIGAVPGQMALFDRLIVDDKIPKVVDLWRRHFDLFFSLAQEMDFVDEARRHSVEPIILVLMDTDPSLIATYTALQDRFPSVTFVPVFNDAITAATPADVRKNHEILRSNFKYSVRMPALDPILTLLIEGPQFSFIRLLRADPSDRSTPGRIALYSWTRLIFNQFRDLQLRLTLKDLRLTLQDR